MIKSKQKEAKEKGFEMETNESIIARQVVAFDERKKVGSVKGLYVDMDARTVKAFVITDAESGSISVLPFEKVLAIGSAFITVEEKGFLLSADSAEGKKAREGEYQLVGVEAYSRAGNLLGKVKSYEFDPFLGTVSKVFVDEKTFFKTEQFSFFAPELIMIDDGTPTAEDYRKGKSTRKKTAKTPARRSVASKTKTAAKPKKAAARPAAKSATKPSSAKTSPVKADTAPVKKEEPKAATSAPATTSAPVKKGSDENASLRAFLTGAKIVEDVASANGKFSVAAGTTLTEEMVADAEHNDALVMLTLSVEE